MEGRPADLCQRGKLAPANVKEPMKKVTVSSYRQDKYYERVQRAFAAVLARGDIVAPVEIFMAMGCLDRREYENWRLGRVPYLERVIQGNLGKVSRVLRLIGFCAHDLKMLPSWTGYNKWGKGHSFRLRFSKSGEKPIEDSYARHFLWNQSAAKKIKAIAGISTATGGYDASGWGVIIVECADALEKLLRARLPKAKDNWSCIVERSDGMVIDGRVAKLLEEAIAACVSVLTEQQLRAMWRADCAEGLPGSGEVEPDRAYLSADLEVAILEEITARVCDEALTRIRRGAESASMRAEKTQIL